MFLVWLWFRIPSLVETRISLFVREGEGEGEARDGKGWIEREARGFRELNDTEFGSVMVSNPSIPKSG